ncbi:hypothetical protein D3C87_1275130 [compost metagenome]
MLGQRGRAGGSAELLIAGDQEDPGPGLQQELAVRIAHRGRVGADGGQGLQVRQLGMAGRRGFPVGAEHHAGALQQVAPCRQLRGHALRQLHHPLRRIGKAEVRAAGRHAVGHADQPALGVEQPAAAGA